MLPIRNISYLLPSAVVFEKKCKNRPKNWPGVQYPLKSPSLIKRFWSRHQGYNIQDSYTLRTPHVRCSQSELTIFKIRKSSAHALFLYNCVTTLRNFKHLAQCLHTCRVWLIHFDIRVLIFCLQFLMTS